MKKLVIITMISVFLIFSSSIIHAQGNFPLWQYPNFYGQYGQQWGFLPYTPGYFSSFNPIGQYGQQWGFQSYTPGNIGSFNAITQPWSSQLRLLSESSSRFMYNSSPAIPSFASVPNNFYYTPSINSLGNQSMGNWGSPFLYLPPLPSNYYYPVGGRPHVPFYSLDEPLFGHDNTKNPYASDALWNLNWDLEDTDITLETPDDGESITANTGETIGFILPNHGDNYDADIEWVLDEDELDENIVEKISDERFPGYWYNNGGLRPAFKDGVEQWVFKAIDLGTATIKLDCINRVDDNTGTIEIEVRVTD